MSRSLSPADPPGHPDAASHSPTPEPTVLGEVSPTPREFARQARDALAHLDDPIYLQRHTLTRFVRANPNTRQASLGRVLRQALLEAIESLRPGSEASPESRALRRYLAAKLCFVERLEIPSILDRLSISRSVYYVELQRAVEAIAYLLYDTWLGNEASAPQGARRSSGESQANGDRALETLPLETSPIEPPRRSNLLLQLTSFVGRERELAEVTRLLGTTRLLTLTGAGGSGKTRLAYRVAEQILIEHPEGYPDGVWVSELASLADPLLVPQALASAIGLKEEAERPILETLVDYLRPRRLLLILDNCEHLLDALARLADALLRACPEVTVLATSREALGTAGETSYRVPSLSLPDRERLSPLADLAECESVRLFFDRARAVQPSFELTEQEAPAVAEICWRLDGIPLAIELAAARMSGLTAEGIARHLDDRFRLLTGGSRTALRRQQTLRATLDWSYDLLSSAERVLFRRLAVFSGGWTLEAAESVCAGEVDEATIEQADVLDLLLRLVDRSLVVAEVASEEERYRFPETIRQYALEKLLESGEAAAVRNRHGDWCLRFVRSLLASAEMSRFYGRTVLELDNLRAAMAWCLETNVMLGLDLAWLMPLVFVKGNRGFTGEDRRWLRALLAKAPERSLARGRALVNYYWLTSDEGELDEAEVVASELLEVAREIGDAELTIEALGAASDACMQRGDHDRANELLDEVLAVATDSGLSASTIAYVDFRKGAVFASNGRYADARARWEAAVDLARSLEIRQVPAWTNAYLGFLDHLEGYPERGRVLLEESTEAVRDHGDYAALGWSLSLLGHVVGKQGDYEQGVAILRESLGVLRNKRHRLRLGRCLCFLAMLDGDRGGNARAARLIGAAMRIIGDTKPEFFASERTDREACLAAARSALGEEAFARAWAEGQAMTLEQAVEYALSDEA